MRAQAERDMATKKDQLRDESIEALLALVDRLNISTDDPRFWPLLAIKLAREYAYEFRTIRQKEGAGRPPSIASDEAMKAGGTLLGLYEAEASRKPDISDTQIFKNLIHHDDFPKWFTQNRDGSKKPPPTTNITANTTHHTLAARLGVDRDAHGVEQIERSIGR